MNIVYIHAHDLGRYCEPMGYAIPAPNITRLAREGVLFRQAFASAPSCAPSRAALVTGRYPHSCGMLGLPAPHLGYRLNDYSHHLAAFLKSHGYETALSGVQHVARAPFAPPEENLPYDRRLNSIPTGSQIHAPTQTAAAAIEYLNEKHEKPFFLSVGFLDPHRNNRGDTATFVETYQWREPATIEDDARFCRPWPHMPDNPITRRETANFKIGVELMDQEVGQVLRTLDQPGLRENTLVIFTTDHGPGVAEMKCTLSDRGTGVTLIMRGPKGFEGGRVIDGMVQHMDLYPTICELLGVEEPDWLQGESFMPLVKGEVEQVHEAIFTEQTYHYGAAPRPFRAVRTERYKYIRCYDENAPRGVDRGPTQVFWEEHGYKDLPHPPEALYDLYFDPNEANNLADRPGNEAILKEMRQRLEKWQEETDDPIRGGVIPEPPVKAKGGR